jgi:hypothetical protein
MLSPILMEAERRSALQMADGNAPCLLKEPEHHS